RLPPLRQRGGGRSASPLRSHLRRQGAGGPRPAAAAALRRGRTQPASLRQPPLGSLQLEALQRLSEPVPALRRRGAGWPARFAAGADRGEAAVKPPRAVVS